MTQVSPDTDNQVKDVQVPQSKILAGIQKIESGRKRMVSACCKVRRGKLLHSDEGRCRSLPRAEGFDFIKSRH